MITAQSKGRRLAKSNPWPTVLACLILLAALSLAFGLGAVLATAGKEDRPPQETTAPATSKEPSAAPAETPEPVRHRGDIVSEGRLLAYDLQEIMQDCCEVYGVPYALVLAIAEVETHFDPDAVSPTHDYGLMQINQCNHEWLQGLGMDPLTHAGNIEAGLYLISDYLSQCQRQFEIVRKRRRNFVVFRRGGGNRISYFLAGKEYLRFAVSGA